MKLWCIRNKVTGKLMSNLTNPSHKFWEKKGSAVTAMQYPNRGKFKGDVNELELVEFELVEVKEDSND